jgi:hypothetical protein
MISSSLCRLYDNIILSLIFLSSFRPWMVSMRSNLLFDMMRNTCSTWMSRSDRELLDDAKRFVMEKAIESSIDGGSSGSCAMGTGGKSSAFPTGGKNSFSPKKKIIDSRPAILSRHSWTITIDRKAGTVTVEGKISSFSMLFNHFQIIIFFISIITYSQWLT